MESEYRISEKDVEEYLNSKRFKSHFKLSNKQITEKNF